MFRPIAKHGRGAGQRPQGPRVAGIKRGPDAGGPPAKRAAAPTPARPRLPAAAAAAAIDRLARPKQQPPARPPPQQDRTGAQRPAGGIGAAQRTPRRAPPPVRPAESGRRGAPATITPPRALRGVQTPPPRGRATPPPRSPPSVRTKAAAEELPDDRPGAQYKHLTQSQGAEMEAELLALKRQVLAELRNAEREVMEARLAVDNDPDALKMAVNLRWEEEELQKEEAAIAGLKRCQREEHAQRLVERNAAGESQVSAMRRAVAESAEQQAALARQAAELRASTEEEARRSDEAARESERARAVRDESQQRQSALSRTLCAKREELGAITRQAVEYRERAAGLRGRWAESKQREAEQKDVLNLHEDARRKLHNQIEELKGNIRVFCRIRGTAERDREFAEWAIDGRSLAFRGKERAALAGGAGRAEEHKFRFDNVFGPEATNERIFKEVEPMVQSCLDGYHVCIFAYGQTGSGKTFTMEGPNDNRGVIPRAVNRVFDTVSQLTVQRGFSCDLSCSFVEIYNEQVRDLLAKGEDADRSLRIRDLGQSGEVEIEGLSQFKVSDRQTVYQLLSLAQMNRASAATAMNSQSSRSHSIFQLRVKTHNPTSDLYMNGMLNLIDLAGSERVALSGVTGARLREAQAINKSLSHLGDAIAAIGKKGYVPYRNSPLTHILKPSLGGNSKALMFVNCSPFREHAEESVNSLRFAQRVNKTNIGAARRGVEE